MRIREVVANHLQRISTNYAQAEQRFDEILRTKLGVRADRSAGNRSVSQLSASQLSASLGSEHVKHSPMHFGSVSAFERGDVTHLSGATAEEIDSAFAGTDLHGLGEAFVKAEREHGVNAWFLASIAALESGYGTSKIARDKNNLFGFCAYDDSPYSSAKRFATREEGVDYVACFLKKEYLRNDGDYFKGLSVDAVGRTYATDPSWADKVSLIMTRLWKAGCEA